MSIAAVIVIALACLGAPPADAQLPSHIEYDFSGTGNLMKSPVVYSGSIDAGEPLLVGGTWSISIDDTGWPGDTDKAARWAYVDATFFAPNYNPFTGTWTGVFDDVTTATRPQWTAGSGVGELVGTAVLQMEIFDFDFDQVIDPDERSFITFAGTIIVARDGTGVWSGRCGLGSYSGYTQNPDPWNFADDVATGSTIIDLELCTTATEAVSWGQVKQFYR